MKLDDFLYTPMIDDELEACESLIRSLQFPSSSGITADDKVAEFSKEYENALNRKIGSDNSYGDVSDFFRFIAQDTMTEFLDNYMQNLGISANVEYRGSDNSYYKKEIVSYINLAGEPYAVQTAGQTLEDNIQTFTDLLKPLKLESLLETDNSAVEKVYDQYAKYLSSDKMEEILPMAKELIRALDFFEINDRTAAGVYRQAAESLFDIGKNEILIPRTHETKMEKLEQALQDAHDLPESEASQTKIEAAQDAIWDECAAISYDLVEDEESPNYAEFKLHVPEDIKEDYLARLNLNLPEDATVNFYLQAESDDCATLKAEINGEIDFTVPLNTVEEAALAYNAERYLENEHKTTIEKRIEMQSSEAKPRSAGKEDLDISDR